MDLGVGSAAAAIFADQNLDAVLRQQRPLLRQGERSLIEEDLTRRRCGIDRRRGNHPHQEPEVLQVGEGREGLSTDGQKDAPTQPWQQRRRPRGVGRREPAIPRLYFPLRTPEHQPGDTDHRRCPRRVLRNLGGEWMGSIDQQIHPFPAQIVNQSFDSSEATDAH